MKAFGHSSSAFFIVLFYRSIPHQLCYMDNQITVKDMLKEMETGDPFSIKYITFDRQRKKGGHIEQYKEAVLLIKPVLVIQPESEGRSPTLIEQKKKKLERLRKRPNHKEWYTRNIQLMVNGHPTGERRKIHPPLVVLFNNKIVVA